MNTHPVEVVTIDEIYPHPHADRLECARVNAWQTIVRKGEYKAGDKAVYVPIDSVLSPALDAILFPPTAKVKLHNRRVRSIRLRGELSQGILINVRRSRNLDDLTVLSRYPDLERMKVGKDVAEYLGITKYEPPTPRYQQFGKRGSYKNNPHFAQYTDIQNFKHFPDLFEEGESVSVTVKLHGTSARYGIVPRNPHRFGWATKLLQRFGWATHEFVYGSRRVQLQTGGSLYYSSDVYAEAAKRQGLDSRLRPGEVVYGEIVGPGIQKGFTYGFAKPTFFAYDVMVDGVYLNPPEFWEWCKERDVWRVPLMYLGEYDKARVMEIASGESIIAPDTQPVIEGVVIKPNTEKTHPRIGRKVLKLVNDEYLMSKSTEYH